MGAIILENFAIGLDVDSTIKDSGLDGRQILGESFVFMRNLKGQFTRVTKDQDRHLIVSFGMSSGIELMQGSQDEDGGFTHTTLGLADNVTSEYGLWDGLMLHFTRVLETGIDNSAQQFGFQEKIFETRCMDTNIVTSEDGC